MWYNHAMGNRIPEVKSFIIPARPVESVEGVVIDGVPIESAEGTAINGVPVEQSSVIPGDVGEGAVYVLDEGKGG